MKTTTTLRSIALALALAGGLGVARADTEPAVAPASSAVGQGLLGQTYGTLTYSYINLDGTSAHGDDYHFATNQPLSAGFDGFFSYDYVDSRFGHENTVMLGVRPFSARYAWGKPFAEAGAGYTWTKYAGNRDNSFVWEAAVGAEFQVTPQATITPYVQYTDAPDLGSADHWNFGARGNHWVNEKWSLTVGVQINDDKDAAFTVGTNFRF